MILRYERENLLLNFMLGNVFLRCEGNYGTRNSPEKFREFRETRARSLFLEFLISCPVFISLTTHFHLWKKKLNEFPSITKVWVHNLPKKALDFVTIPSRYLRRLNPCRAGFQNRHRRMWRGGGLWWQIVTSWRPRVITRWKWNL